MHSTSTCVTLDCSHLSIGTAPSNRRILGMLDTTGGSAGFTVQGRCIPAVGLGTFQGDVGNSLVKHSVAAALRQGYRHIDTAAAYGNETEVGEAIKESGIPRSEVFITTKL